MFPSVPILNLVCKMGSLIGPSIKGKLSRIIMLNAKLVHS